MNVQGLMKTVLFLCTANSCRSQLAEAIVNACLGDRWQAFSAGTRPAGYVHPKAIQVLEETGIAHQGRSKSADEFHGRTFDVVITVCDDANEQCPLWLGKAGRRLHVGLPDPAKASGSEEEILEVFRRVREDIRARILPLLEELSASGEPQ